ncbi:serine protease inhibitor [Capsulimonas corticalis]|uniref:Serine protease inhibitor n=1 Tax=Capsulimonas corticalis TaxID=2219043 RepID=A0A402D0F5_9BACT|nr:serpin family protein [Capsulimonas corticalis]BDI33681.1 serine protease inhibitor [Capsulimonas corticalis]
MPTAGRFWGMPSCVCVFGAVSLLAGCGQGAPPARDVKVVAADAHVRQVAAANTDFGFRLLRRLALEKTDANVFFSPFGVTQALTVAMNGADGSTQATISQTLGLQGIAIKDINSANTLLLPSLESADPQVDLSVANSIWVGKGITPSAAFQQICVQSYDAQAAALDFSSPSAADTINSWVDNKTNGKIDKIVSPSDIADSQMVLTNAVYFHGKWGSAFEKPLTRNGLFHLASARVKTLPFMSQDATFNYLDSKTLQAVSLPYGDGRISLYIIAPKDSGGLNAFLSTFHPSDWNDLLQNMRPASMTMIMPRFHVSYEARLNDALASLGMGAAFQPGANFSPMGLRDGLISAARHKAILEVDEEGTIAAASTEIYMTASVKMPPVNVMRVDRPFFCAIRDNATGTLLFAGAIRDPEAM